MWPWGHLAVAYLVYTLYTHSQTGRRPRALPVLVVAIGSQVPDLIDKPLAWSVGVLPGGRTLTHSLFFALLVLPTVYTLARHVGRADGGIAFAIGHLSHLLTDIPPAALLSGDRAAMRFLVWPILEPPAYEAVDSVLAGFLRYSMDSYEWVQLGLVGVALIVWYRDGTPGLGYLRRGVEHAASRVV